MDSGVIRPNFFNLSDKDSIQIKQMYSEKLRIKGIGEVMPLMRLGSSSAIVFKLGKANRHNVKLLYVVNDKDA